MHTDLSPQHVARSRVRHDASTGRSIMDQAISRAADAQRIDGNSVRLLRDAAENYPAWLDAIASAERYVYFEAYIMRDDVSGRRFADALIEKARAGVTVRLLYDWMGAFAKTPSRFWESLRAAGVEVRCFNPFTLASPLGWVHRDHRKSVVVDGRIGFITGLCVGDAWVGDPERGLAPWRDTGVEVRGPAVVEIERAFSRVWAVVGAPIPREELTARDSIAVAGDTSVRVVASEPWRARLLRLDELVAGAARETLWLADAYYAGMPTHVQALRAAAKDGVDVRLLVPGGSDIPLLRPLSQAGYRPLLEAGVRVFEWNGPMMHAKTSVADGRLARVGSSNLNIASWLGNYELDAVIEDTAFAECMVESYLDDLAHATEVVLHRRHRRHRSHDALPGQSQTHRMRDRRRGSGSAGRGVAGAIRLGNTVSAAVTDRRVLASADSRAIAVAGAVLVALAIVAVVWPRVFAIPIAIFSLWFGGAMLLQSYRLRAYKATKSALVPDAHDEQVAADNPGSASSVEDSAESSTAVTP
ncbi:MAG TPA: phospholipase D-like domain-containing protein [Gemmatimonadaceae bacterium]|nr:phospholipase D-like domain-containing protein [Gemmatimonadaceae bacterium]